ncbi:MAG: FAD-binding oxidoreductase, partial [Pseudomonadota bacterium]|nr:FAD-binding oxidoreductase [Pseudomonadota bacterium]
MAQTPTVTAALLDQFGPTVVLTDTDAKAGYTLDWRGKYPSDALAVVRPDSTAMVAEVVRLCARHDVAMTPQGGNTGLVGGSVPTQPRREIVLSLERMNAVEDVDAVGNTMLVQTGCILAHAQQAAEAEDRLFPLSLGAEGTCRIGGNLSTNAGGINVLKYGNMRDLVLGLEVVLADGQVWNGLNRLRKDNTGYDLKHLFIGAEGSLGIITRAVLKL